MLKYYIYYLYMTSIKNFTIYGERCSGTNFTEELFTNNFNIEVTWKYGWKHFFGFYDFTSKQEDETLFIGIIRNPIHWLHSFYKSPHHIPEHNKPLKKFLFNEFYSHHDDDKTYDIIKEDLNYVTKEKYKNIFELRKMKNDYLMNIMPTKVKNYILIRYEDLLENKQKVLIEIKNKYNLTLKNNKIQEITYYKKQKNQKFSPKPITFSNETLTLIKKNLDLEQEKKLGYNIIF
jgi:hypothetical protein